MRRGLPWLAGLGMALLAAAAAAQTAKGPQRNLLVELRWAELQEASGRSAAAGGGVVVGTGGAVDAHGSAVVRSGRRDEQTRALQRLTVLNGASAGVRLGEAVPLQWLDVALTPAGPVGVLRQGWVETGSSFQVRPQWAGGSAPVQVDIAHQAGGMPQREGVFTTLQLPLGEWVTVAQSGESRQHEARGTLSSRDAERRTRRLLQMRVSAP